MNMTFESPQDAEDAFYDAFEEANLENMMSAWADTDDIICIQPMREQVKGREAVSQTWQELFASDAKVEIEIHHQHWLDAENIAVHVVHEQLIINGDRKHKPPALIATNMYQQTEQGWRMLLHHASPPPPPPMPHAPGMTPGVSPGMVPGMGSQRK